MGPLGLSSLSLGLASFGGLRPSFALNFLGETLDSRVTFTRGSIGTRINSAGLLETVSSGNPRFDYDPTQVAGTVGSELVTNGNFSDGTTGWIGTSATLSAASGVLQVTSGGSAGRAEQPGIPASAGKTYLVSGTYYVQAGDTAIVQVFESTGSTLLSQVGSTNSTTPVAFSGYVVATGNFYLKLRSSIAGGSTFFDNVSIKEVSFAIRGLLVEDGRTNLVPNSRTWTLGSVDVTVAQTQVGADGTSNSAFLITEVNGGTGQKFFFPANSTVAAGTAYALTALVKPGTATRVQMATSSATFGAGIWANFSLVGAGSVLASTGATATYIKLLGNGFYAITVVATPTTSGSGSPNIVLAFINSDTAARLPTYNGTGLTLIVDHAQVEAGVFPTSIIPTSGSTVARSGDSISNPLGSWFNASEGTIFCEGSVSVAAGVLGSALLAGVDDGTNNNRIYLRTTPSTGANQATMVVGGVVNVNDSFGPNIGNLIPKKAAWAYKTGTQKAALNGTAYTLGSSPVAVPVVNRLYAGAGGGGSLAPNGHIRRIAYYPVALTAEQLQAITM